MIPDNAVEAAWGYLWKQGIDRPANRDEMRAALEVAAPFIKAQALEEAATDLDDKRLLSKAFHIFYPEWLRERAARLVSK